MRDAADFELEDELLEPEVAMELGFSTIIILENIPVVPKDKFEKLKAVLTKLMLQVGSIKDFYLATDENGTTKGFAFVEYATKEAAEQAVLKLNGHKLDKQHIFRVHPYDDFAKSSNIPEEYVPPTLSEYKAPEKLKSWLLDPRGLDQYVMRYADVTEVAWNDPKGQNPEIAMQRSHWSESYVQWSPHGTYLATIHQKGVALWAGPNFDKIHRFSHDHVKLIDFSPCEKYLVTAAPQVQDHDNPTNPRCIIVWDVRTGAELRGFPGGDFISWPIFKWSHDDKYLARIGPDAISIYETPSMDLLDGKSIKIPGVRDFSWSPTDHLIAAFVPEQSPKPASMILMEIPSRREKRVKNLVNVNDCKLYWQSSGDLLCVKVERFTKTKKSTFNTLEIFRIRERDIPTDMVEVKDTIVSFAWEPRGTRFGVIHGELPRPDISFYEVLPKSIAHLKTMEKKSANQLHWSPQGRFLVIAGLGTNFNGALEFYDAQDLETMGTEEHFTASSIEWDPTGRFVCSVVSFWKHSVENGFHLYTFQGKVLKRNLKEKFFQLLWRPRPPSLLPPEKLKHIKDNVRTYGKKFKRLDAEAAAKEEEEKKKKREALRHLFTTMLQEREKQWQSETARRKELRGGYPSDNEGDYEERTEWVEYVESISEIPLD